MTSQAARAEAVATAPRKSPVGRIVSLDWVRGLFLCASVSSASFLAPRPDFLKHSQWVGVTGVDLIFPLFVTLSGCGLAFAYRNRVGWGATLRRSLVLLVCGLLFNAVAAQSLDLETLRWTGPLQVYAVLVLVIGLFHLVARTPRAWIFVTLALAAAQASFLALWQLGCPDGELLPTCNPSRTIDLAALGASHVYAAGALGHDPEGLIGIAGALVTACAGVTAGHLALASRTGNRGPFHLLAWATAVLVLALAAGQLLPAMKRLWTTPFGLGVAALGVVILAVGMAVMDSDAPEWWRRLRPRLGWPMIALGRNSLLVYFGSHLLVMVLLQHGGETSWAVQLAERVDWLGNLQASFLVSMLVFWVLVASVLHRFKIYLRP